MIDYDPNYVSTKIYTVVGQKAIVLNNLNQILVLHRSDKSSSGGKWSLPGGALELEEDPLIGIKREILEETEMEVSNPKPFALRTYTVKDDFTLIIGYFCKAISEEVILNWEHDSFKWLSKEVALELDLTDDGRFFIEHFESSVNLI